MKPYLFLPVFLYLFVSVVATSSLVFAQTDGDEAGNFTRSPKIKAFDDRVLEKLDRMSPDKADTLDQKLAQALTLYYDGFSEQALPLFQEISSVMETSDVLFWTASCAAAAGRTDLAISKFRQMLTIDSGLYRVRLELARVYFETGRYQKARQELDTIASGKPPEGVLQEVKRLRNSMAEATRKWFSSLRLSMGLQYDTAVNAAPDDMLISPSATGGTITLSERERALKDFVFVDSIAGHALYDMGDPRYWMWDTGFLFHQNHVLKYSEFSQTQLGITTGPWLSQRRGLMKLPAGYSRHFYDHEGLYHRLGFYPSYEYFFSDRYSLKGYVALSMDEYDEEIKWGEENSRTIIGLNPRVFFNGQNDILSFFISYEDCDANMERYAFRGVNLGLSYYKRLVKGF
jgi:tetratricopeptide (TPR) repeat protein